MVEDEVGGCGQLKMEVGVVIEWVWPEDGGGCGQLKMKCVWSEDEVLRGVVS